MQLCRISCSDEEFEEIYETLPSILDMVDQLDELDTEGVQECNHVLETVKNVMREDEVGETLDRETFLSNCPSQVGGMTRVPPVIKF